MKANPFWGRFFNTNISGRDVSTAGGKIGEEINFRIVDSGDDAFENFYVGDPLLDLGAEWFSARDGYIRRSDQGDVRLARFIVYRFRWSFQRKEEIIEGLRDLYYDEIYNFDVELEVENEDELERRWRLQWISNVRMISEDIERAENYTGDDVRKAFKPYDFSDVRQYSFSAYDPEALMNELIAARQFCANKGRTLSLTVSGGTKAEDGAQGKERVVNFTSKMNDDVLREICSQIGAHPDRPVHLSCFCV